MTDINLFSSLSNGNNLDSLITAPLAAISKANAMMLGGQAQFILDYCFKNNNDSYSPIMIKLEYSKENDIKEYFEIPLLTLLPLNNLAVNQVNLRFTLEVLSAESYVYPKLEKGTNSNLAKPNILKRKAKICARLSRVIKSKDTNKKIHKGIDFSIKTKQIPLTKGITTLIDVYSKHIIVSKE